MALLNLSVRIPSTTPPKMRTSPSPPEMPLTSQPIRLPATRGTSIKEGTWPTWTWPSGTTKASRLKSWSRSETTEETTWPSPGSPPASMLRKFQPVFSESAEYSLLTKNSPISGNRTTDPDLCTSILLIHPSSLLLFHFLRSEYSSHLARIFPSETSDQKHHWSHDFIDRNWDRYGMKCMKSRNVLLDGLRCIGSLMSLFVFLELVVGRVKDSSCFPGLGLLCLGLDLGALLEDLIVEVHFCSPCSMIISRN